MSDAAGSGPRTAERDAELADGGETAAGEHFPEPLPRRARRVGADKRKARRRARRFQRSLPTAMLIGTLAIAGVTALVFVGRAVDRTLDPTDPVQTEVAVERGNPQRTLVLATFDERRANDGADLITVLAFDDRPGRGTILFVPSSTLADVPGYGLEHIGRAFAFGGGPLLDATIDNALGVDFDGVAGLSRQGWATVFTRVGGLTVDLPERLVTRSADGTGEVRFEPGPQHLDGPRLAELLTFVAEGESDLDRLPRAQLVLEALLDRMAEDPGSVDDVFADGAPMLDTTTPWESVRDLFADLVRARQQGELQSLTLPVSPLGAEDSYRLDTDRVVALVNDHFAGSVPVASGSEGRRLQILNGNGSPGIGQEVAQLLLPSGYKVVLTDNADRFDYVQTLVVVYDDTPEQLELARQVRDLLGVGTVEVNRTPQSVVDITIVVGHDFLEVVGEDTDVPQVPGSQLPSEPASPVTTASESPSA